MADRLPHYTAEPTWVAEQLGEDEFAVFNRETSDFHLLNLVDFSVLTTLTDTSARMTAEDLVQRVSREHGIAADADLERYVGQTLEQLVWVGIVWESSPR